MFKKFVSYYKRHLKLFILDTICALFVSGIDLLFPILTQKSLKEYIPNKEIDILIKILVILFITYILRLFFTYFIGYYGHLMGSKIEGDMRKDLFIKIESMDTSYFDTHKTGALMSSITSHLRDVSEMSHHAPEDIIIALAMTIGSFFILSRINFKLTLLLFLLLLLLVIFSVFRRKKMLKAFKETRKSHEEMNSKIESSFNGIRLTKAYTNEDYEINNFDKINNDYVNSWKKAYYQLGIFNSGAEFITGIINIILLLVGGYLVYKSKLDSIDLMTFFLYLNFVLKPINRLIQSMQQIQNGFSGIERFYSIMTTNPHIKNKENPIILKEVKGYIKFDKVNFEYNEDSQILNNFSLEINPGKKIALVGKTGVGKTTISKLIPRFYDVNSGNIYIDNYNIKDLDIYSLRKNIGHVQQDVYIFYGTILDNIKYGKIDATFEEVIEASKKANIYDFIMSLENNYDTIVGEKGVRLSGGQKQRISIARLFLKNPKIIILDEATSSLDNQTEELIQEAFDDLSKDKTTIIIAHRLSTIKNADEIIVLDEDGIKERGTHEELLNNKGYYYNLYIKG